MAKNMTDAVDEITSALNGSVRIVSDPEEVVYTLPIAASSLMDYLCDELYSAISVFSPREFSFSADDVRNAMRWLLDARLCYVSGIRSDVHPRDVEYPAIMGAVLAAIGKYRDTARNVTLVPTVNDPEMVDVDENGYVVAIKRDRKLKQPANYRQVISALRVFGVPTVFGLPMEKTVETDEFYRISTATSVLCGSRPEAPSAVALFSRALVEVVYLANLFGDARISYTALSSVRNSIHDIVLRNVDGYRVRSV